MVQGGDAQGSSDDEDNNEPSRQSPWELFDEGLDAQQAVQEGPVMDSPVAERLKHALHTLSASEQFEVFVELLDPAAAYPASDTGLLQAMPLSQHMPHKLVLHVLGTRECFTELLSICAGQIAYWHACSNDAEKYPAGLPQIWE